MFKDLMKNILNDIRIYPLVNFAVFFFVLFVFRLFLYHKEHKVYHKVFVFYQTEMCKYQMKAKMEGKYYCLNPLNLPKGRL